MMSWQSERAQVIGNRARRHVRQQGSVIRRPFTRFRKQSAITVILCGLTLLAGCNPSKQLANSNPGQAPPTLRATHFAADTVAPTPEQPTPLPEQNGWVSVAQGVETRHWQVPVEAGQPPADLTAVRLDPTQIRFHMGYNPTQPPSLAEWTQEAHPLAAINGGFFTKSYESTALVISGGNASGESYVGRGGMFSVDSAGHVALRSLADQPYDPAEQLVEAMQSWPMLVKPGGVPAYSSNDDNDHARRSVVALDRDGRVLLLVCANTSFTLHALSDWLVASDLTIDSALNLDGGSSTALYLDGAVRVAPFGRLPLVLFADPR